MRIFQPVRLKEIRIARGLTEERVAESLGLTKQMISKYETNVSIPYQDTLSNMARLFRVPLVYFDKPDTAVACRCSALFYKTSTNTPGKAVDLARVHCKWISEIVQECREIHKETRSGTNGIPAPNLPRLPDQCSPYESADLLREHWGLGDEPISHLVGSLEANGIIVSTHPSPGLQTDGYAQIVDSLPVIFMNSHKGTAVRQRFLLAQALGHLLMHCDLSESEYRLKQKHYDAEANAFAERFLLPAFGLDNMAAPADLARFVELKRHWKVSIAAMITHCIDNGVMAVEAAKAKKRLYRQYGRKDEPLDDVLPLEQPSLLASIFTERIVDDDSFAALMNTLALPVDIIESLVGLTPGFLADYFGDGEDWYSGLSSGLQPPPEQMTMFDTDEL